MSNLTIFSSISSDRRALFCIPLQPWLLFSTTGASFHIENTLTMNILFIDLELRMMFVVTWSITDWNCPLSQMRLSLLRPVSTPSLVLTVVESWYLKLPWQNRSRLSPSLNVRYLTPSPDSDEGKTKLLVCVNNGGYLPVNWSRFTVQLSPPPDDPRLLDKDKLYFYFDQVAV